MKAMTYCEVRADAGRRLAAAGVPDADIDAELLLEYSSGRDRAHVLTVLGEPVPEEVLARYEEAVKLRLLRIPLQQITGETEFMGIRFLVSDKVLCPRQDTETVAEEAIHVIRQKQKETAAGGRKVRVLDLCTGSGCLIVSVARFCPGTEAAASDISPEALEIAEKNAALAGVSVSFTESDLFEKISGSFDVIISNPPYIRSRDIPDLMEEVKDHEPHLALDGGPDGLLFYRKIASGAPHFLNDGGVLLFEIGMDEGEDVRKILGECGFADIQVRKDLAGNDRLVLGSRYV